MYLVQLYKMQIFNRRKNIIYYSYQNRYGSTWYKIPVKIQKMLLMMQIRSKKLCTLTAGGLYEMNMENFAIVCNIMGQL